MKFDDRDTSFDSSYDTIVAESGKRGSPDASAGTASARGFEDADPLIPLRQATRRYRNLLGNVKIVQRGSQRFVRKSDLDTYVNKQRRGTKLTDSQTTGAAETVSKEIANARAARRRAFEARNRNQ